MTRILIALGGNALGDSPKDQINIAKETSKHIVDLVENGYEIIIAHGNGPQVGMINLALEDVHMQFPECTAMSQGYIGYHLQNSIYEELCKRNINKGVVSVITQSVIDRKDEAFNNPTKPIGRFYTEEEANEISKEKGYIMKEDSGRGYRRVVPSPKPIDIVEKESIKSLLNQGHIVITVGGGGIPVIRDGYSLVGVDCVIDKDLAGELMAELVDVDFLFILTAVDRIAINFGTPKQVNLDKMSLDDAYKYIKEGHFLPGSMLPKVLAAIKFVESKDGRKAIISSVEKANDVLVGKSGTVIYK